MIGVQSVNGKQKFVKLNTDDIPESDEKLYFTPSFRKALFSASEDARSSLQHILDTRIHLSKQQVDDIKKNIEHRKDTSIHLTEKEKKHLLSLRSARGRRGPSGPPGPAGSSVSSGGGVSPWIIRDGDVIWRLIIVGNDLEVQKYDGVSAWAKSTTFEGA